MTESKMMKRYQEILSRRRYIAYPVDCEPGFCSCRRIGKLSEYETYQLSIELYSEAIDLAPVEKQLGILLPNDIKAFYAQWGSCTFGHWDVGENMLTPNGMLETCYSGGVGRYGKNRACIPILAIEDGDSYFGLRTRTGMDGWEVVYLESMSQSEPMSDATIVTDKSFFDLLDRLDRTNGYPPVPALPEQYTFTAGKVDSLEELQNPEYLKRIRQWW